MWQGLWRIYASRRSWPPRQPHVIPCRAKHLAAEGSCEGPATKKGSCFLSFRARVLEVMDTLMLKHGPGRPARDRRCQVLAIRGRKPHDQDLQLQSQRSGSPWQISRLEHESEWRFLRNVGLPHDAPRRVSRSIHQRRLHPRGLLMPQCTRPPQGNSWTCGIGIHRGRRCKGRCSHSAARMGWPNSDCARHDTLRWQLCHVARGAGGATSQASGPRQSRDSPGERSHHSQSMPRRCEYSAQQRDACSSVRHAL